jgi:dipeptidyl aminopeptidase/acylaminoacyl peptidase
VEVHALSKDGRRLAIAVNEDGYAPLRVRDLRTKSAPREVAVRGLPQGVASSFSWSADGSKLAFRFESPAHPSDIWVWDAATGEARAVTQSSTAGIPATTFVASELVHYPTFDGRTISGFLYRPAGSTGGPVPVIVNVHGGPEGQSRATFSALTQYFLGRGLAVFYPNVRGSTGYGKTFEHLDDVEKRLDSIRDLAAAAAWLAQEGIAPADRIAVSGGSYGGYATLASLAFHPDVWACGASTVGISSLRTFIANTGPWRRALRAAEYGDPARDSVAMDAASPLLHADRIRAPLFVIQGANDPRVPKSESDQIVAAVRKNGGIAEYLVFDDEGHGLDKLENRVKAYTAMAAFYEKHLLTPAAAAP